MKFAYADPPYLGASRKHYRDHPEHAVYDTVEGHRQLIDRLVTDFPDGWALSMASKNLRELLPLCPPDVRVIGKDLGESRADKRTCSPRCRVALSRRLAKLADEQCAGDPSHQHHSHDEPAECERCGHLPAAKEHFARDGFVPTSCHNCAVCREDEEAAKRLWTQKGLASGAIRQESWKI